MGYSFTKLFSSITESTIWVAPDPHRLTWITMLAMADRKGRIFASIPGLANRARLQVADVETAILSFLGPDQYSRTKDQDGKRIEEIDGGWRLINYEKYRALCDAESVKESKRRYINARRERERDVEVSRKSRHQSKQAEAEAEAEAETPYAADAAFVEFWSGYPRKKSKGEAWRAWKKVPAVLHDDLMHGLKIAIMSDDWGRENGRYIPHPATWLNARGWEDEPQSKAQRKFVV